MYGARSAIVQAQCSRLHTTPFGMVRLAVRHHLLQKS